MFFSHPYIHLHLILTQWFLEYNQHRKTRPTLQLTTVYQDVYHLLLVYSCFVNYLQNSHPSPMSHSKRHSRKVALQPRNPDYRGQTRSGTVRSAQVWVHPKNYWFTLWLDVERFLPWDFRTLANWQTLCSSSLYVTVSSSPGSFPSLVRREKTDCSMGVVFQSEVRRRANHSTWHLLKQNLFEKKMLKSVLVGHRWYVLWDGPDKIWPRAAIGPRSWIIGYCWCRRRIRF